ncbi:hypothetical protein [Schleiferilactobacillus harbinensis]|uniref:hypothetical protein n=1 Tax=Schleiferilactobacillus harbinensis TaxID=304207 RepID=UPI0011717B44|nr:hypothetical protein [Schleiferilactobacillus harbinensis]MCT2909872.1 hypothetical protein [Schleiferilactobacillus harbinensis]GEK05006.1 hypothetical protein LHA01_02450 [Schleiferilactobacillus harbinensis]
MRSIDIAMCLSVLSAFFALAGCQPNQSAQFTDNQPTTSRPTKRWTPAYKKQAKKNLNTLTQEFSQSPRVIYRIEDDVVNFVPATIQGFSQKGKSETYQAFIRGYVTDWKQVSNPTLRPATKLVVYVQQVLDGDTSLKGKTLTVSYIGGYVPYSNVAGYAIDKQNAMPAQRIVLAQNDELPTPPIGTTLIIPIHKYFYKGASTQYQQAVKEENLDKAYAVTSDYYATWILDSRTGKLTNNNVDVPEKKPQNAPPSMDNVYKLKGQLEKRL